MIPKGIIVHCSASPQGRGDDASTIHEWHKKRKFDGIGYNAVVLEDGTVQSGRPDYWRGAHAKGYNNYLGICLMGKKKFTKEQFAAAQKWIFKKMKKYNIHRDKVKGHCEVSKKTCPNFDVKSKLMEI
jgi:N-acetylmuramoyl-L-alanine amidase